MRTLLGFMAVQVFESFQFLNESFVLVLQNSYAVLQTLHVFLFLPTTLSGRLPAETKGALIGQCVLMMMIVHLTLFSGNYSPSCKHTTQTLRSVKNDIQEK